MDAAAVRRWRAALALIRALDVARESAAAGMVMECQRRLRLVHEAEQRYIECTLEARQ